MSLFLAFDAAALPPTEPGPEDCAAAPMFWFPDAGVHHGFAVMGVRWFCERCGIEGPAEFGEARGLGGLALRSEVAFFEVAATAGLCPDWQDEAGAGTASKTGKMKGLALAQAVEAAHPDED